MNGNVCIGLYTSSENRILITQQSSEYFVPAPQKQRKLTPQSNIGTYALEIGSRCPFLIKPGLIEGVDLYQVAQSATRNKSACIRYSEETGGAYMQVLLF